MLPIGSIYSFKDFSSYKLRASFPEKFNVHKEGKAYYNFNIQKGITDCSNQKFKNDCDALYYVNHKLSVHRFKEYRYSIFKNLNSFKTIEEAERCARLLSKLTFKKQIRIKSYSICDS